MARQPADLDEHNEAGVSSPLIRPSSRIHNGDEDENDNERSHAHDSLLDSHDDNDDDDAPHPSESTLTPTFFIYLLTITASLSGLLFGYDTGVISSTLVSLHNDLSRPLSTWDKSVITSCTSLFALFASPLTGLLADAWGRKSVVLVADVLFIIGALVQAAAHSVGTMVLGRSIVGVAIGGASFVVPLYISELAPGKWRGRMVTVSSLFITGGQVVAYVVGWGFSEREGGWRWMVGLGAVPAGVQIGLLVGAGVPESARWMVGKGRVEEARGVLERVYGVDREGGREGVERVLRRVEREVREEEEEIGRVGRLGQLDAEGKYSWWNKTVGSVRDRFALLVDVPGHRRALIIACMLQAAQQLCGFNSLMYFSATIFSLLSFRSPTLTSLSIASTNFLSTLLAYHAIDRIGRRRILLLSIPFMILGLSLCAVAFNFVDLNTESPSALETGRTAGTDRTWPLTILLSMLLYVSTYALGLGTVPWQQSELFPLSVRSLGSSLSTATNWFSNFVVGISFLPMMNAFTPQGTFALYAGVCGGAWVAVWFLYPETAGLELEDVGGLLREGFGVRESLVLARGRREGRGG
ncbi:putative MFS myo-inositol transporter [Dendryphion nanum]|uniref:MFS myo-inositol transporter n=1 Tax=Dendryphion nanum TaxID=256645 RepID=A0A9P9IBC1_9PLEO|nr:putative MFS myo-inositol transporter [Dendryphion nanum]